MSNVVDVSSETFKEQVLEEGGLPVVVDFWSSGCPHCLRFNPEFEAAAETMDGEVKFAKASVAQAMPIFREYGVRSTPTIVVFRGGEEVARTAGSMSASDLMEWLRQELGNGTQA